MHKTVSEGEIKIRIEATEKISKDMEVFYNPIMKHNRDISILLLKCIDRNSLQVCLPLAGTGVRGIRFIKEINKNKIKKITFNDYCKDAVKSIKKGLALNKISLKDKRLIIKNEDANLMLLNSKGFDYIDIDPFGSPNPFLDSAVKRISREGILAVTATDTAALTGTYTKPCKRKYWAKPLRNEMMHETGLRILIRKCQLIGAQFEKALIPIYSYSKDHYFRIFFNCKKGKKDVDKIIEKHGMFLDAGEMWLGELWDNKLTQSMYSKALEKEKLFGKELISFLKIIKEESMIDSVCFYDIHKLVKDNKIKKIPKKSETIKKIRKKGYKAYDTHFTGTGIRSNIKEKELINILKK